MSAERETVIVSQDGGSFDFTTPPILPMDFSKLEGSAVFGIDTNTHDANRQTQPETTKPITTELGTNTGRHNRIPFKLAIAVGVLATAACAGIKQGEVQGVGNVPAPAIVQQQGEAKTSEAPTKPEYSAEDSAALETLTTDMSEHPLDPKLKEQIVAEFSNPQSETRLALPRLAGDIDPGKAEEFKDWQAKAISIFVGENIEEMQSLINTMDMTPSMLLAIYEQAKANIEYADPNSPASLSLDSSVSFQGKLGILQPDITGSKELADGTIFDARKVFISYGAGWLAACENINNKVKEKKLTLANKDTIDTPPETYKFFAGVTPYASGVPIKEPTTYWVNEAGNIEVGKPIPTYEKRNKLNGAAWTGVNLSPVNGEGPEIWVFGRTINKKEAESTNGEPSSTQLNLPK